MIRAEPVFLHIAPIAAIEVDECLLSAEERNRTEQYQNAAARRAFVAGRVLMRRMLGQTIGCAAAEVAIIISETGRPDLDPRFHPGGPSFSLSHTTETLALGVSAARVGVDIEAGDRRAKIATLAQRILGPDESNFAARMGADKRAFLAAWTAKEAAAKADGAGLRMEPRNFQLLDLPAPGSPPVAVRCRDLSIFWVRAVAVDGQICAVASREPAFELRLSLIR
jgi:4'-phosphopantetheinyl transferase